MSDTIDTTENPGCREQRPCSALPTSAGFYWWRATECDAWRMVQIVDCGNGYLNSYDVQLHNWGGRSMKSWAEWFPVGQWVAVLPPNVRISDPAP